MEINVYKKYDFSYNEKQFMKSFKEAIVEKGYTSLALFYGLIQKFGYSSYETARSYYNLRRVVPLELFASLCKYLNLNATKLMYPSSIFEYNFSRPIMLDAVSSRTTFSHFLSVFEHEENLKILFETMTKEEYNESVKNDIYHVALILAKFNYLLQKYYFAGLSNSELIDLQLFLINHFVERETNSKFDFKVFDKWKKEIKSTDFLDAFYQKYALCFIDRKCSEIIKTNKNYLTKEVFSLINNLLYSLDKVEY